MSQEEITREIIKHPGQMQMKKEHAKTYAISKSAEKCSALKLTA